MKTELLMPAGSIESLRAAIEGGADAVYLGLSRFNARGRARNFGPRQFAAAIEFANQHNVRIYVTLNTLIKNSELSQLFDTLYLIEQSGAPVIIQDIGAYYIIKKYFPKIEIHASTQMGIHNSDGVRSLAKLGFERVILSRELTFPELEKIKKKSPVELEIFVHGALCYSFSGYCLFSSYLGGMSANRGQCRQPCRRIYQTSETEREFFNLNDLALIRLVPRLAKLGIASLKVEGRMKAAEYVLRVAQAYRMVLDDALTVEKAQELLRYDMGRTKTEYFMGGDIADSLTTLPYTGIPIGKIESCSAAKFSFYTKEAIALRDRLRVLPKSGMDSAQVKIAQLICDGEDVHAADAGALVTVVADTKGLSKGDPVFLSGTASMKFSNKLPEPKKSYKERLPEFKKKKFLRELSQKSKQQQKKLFVRINDLKWLPKIFFDRIDYLVIQLDKSGWQAFDLSRPFLQKNRAKIILQLPLFISEKELAYYKEAIKKMYDAGGRSFMVSQLAQLEMFASYKNITIYTSEQVYVSNLAAEAMLQEHNILGYVLPFENDFPNLLAGSRNGIVPLYFYPPLFYSRMPIEIEEGPIQDKTGSYLKRSNSGMTILLPSRPVSLLQHHDKLRNKGFSQFLIDFSFEKPSQKSFNRILKKFHASEAEQPSTIFNFKRGLS